MTEDTHILEQIDRYLEGGMGQEEHASFERMLATDADLASLLEASQWAEQVVIGHEMLKIKEQMTHDLAKPKASINKYWLGLLVVAGIGAGVYVWNSASQKQQVLLSTKENKVLVVSAEKSVLQESVSSKEVVKEKSILTTSKKYTSDETKPLVEEANTTENTVNTLSSFSTTQSFLEEKAAHQTLPLAKNNPCEGLNITFEFLTLPTCKGGATGEAYVKQTSIKGGTAPYIFSLGDTKHFGNGNITGLSQGTYHLYVKDANDCVLQHPNMLVINEMACESAKEFTYNPAYDPAWVIPYDVSKKAVAIKIVDKSGQTVYYSLVSNTHPSEWNGESNTGATLGIGYHLYLIEYADGTVDKGAITILR
jgi:hypothetical protein